METASARMRAAPVVCNALPKCRLNHVFAAPAAFAACLFSAKRTRYAIPINVCRSIVFCSVCITSAMTLVIPRDRVGGDLRGDRHTPAAFRQPHGVSKNKFFDRLSAPFHGNGALSCWSGSVVRLLFVFLFEHPKPFFICRKLLRQRFDLTVHFGQRRCHGNQNHQ